MRLLKAAGKRLHQPIFKAGDVCREGARPGNVIIRKADRRRSFPLTELPPGEVVEGAQGVGDAPMRHNAYGVGLERLLKAFDPFLMVEAKAPIQSEIEPALCLRRTGGDMAGVTPEVEVLHASPSTRRACGRRLYCRTCSPKETDATLRKEQVQIVYEIVCIVFGEDRFRPSLPELFTVCKVSFGA